MNLCTMPSSPRGSRGMMMFRSFQDILITAFPIIQKPRNATHGCRARAGSIRNFAIGETLLQKTRSLEPLTQSFHLAQGRNITQKIRYIFWSSALQECGA